MSDICDCHQPEDILNNVCGKCLLPLGDNMTQPPKTLKELLERAFAFDDRLYKNEGGNYQRSAKFEHNRIAPLAKEIILELCEALDDLIKQAEQYVVPHGSIRLKNAKQALTKVEARLKGENE